MPSFDVVCEPDMIELKTQSSNLIKKLPIVLTSRALTAELSKRMRL